MNDTIWDYTYFIEMDDEMHSDVNDLILIATAQEH